jgi:hypothetical protein
VPKDGVVSRADRSYRRGMVLGLTMAELMLILLFLILLAMAAFESDRDHEVENERQSIEAWVELDAGQRQNLVALLNTIPIQKVPIEEIQPLIVLHDQLAQAGLAVSEAVDQFETVSNLVPLATLWGQLEEAAKAAGVQITEIVPLIDRAALGQKIEDAARAQGISLDSIAQIIETIELRPTPETSGLEAQNQLAEANEQLGEMREQLQSAQRETAEALKEQTEAEGEKAEAEKRQDEAETRGMVAEALLRELQNSQEIAERQLAETQKELDALILKLKRGENPSCWYEEDGEQVVFLFEIAVFDRTFVIVDRPTPDHLLASRASMESIFRNVDFGIPLTDSEFKVQTKPFDIAGDRGEPTGYECVFYVKIWNEMSRQDTDRWIVATEMVVGDSFFRSSTQTTRWPH